MVMLPPRPQPGLGHHLLVFGSVKLDLGGWGSSEHRRQECWQCGHRRLQGAASCSLAPGSSEKNARSRSHNSLVTLPLTRDVCQLGESRGGRAAGRCWSQCWCLSAESKGPQSEGWRQILGGNPAVGETLASTRDQAQEPSPRAVLLTGKRMLEREGM